MARSGIDFASLIGSNEKSENDENIEKIGRRSRTQSRSSNRSISTISLCSSAEDVFEEFDEENATNKDLEMEASSKGKVKGSIPGNYFKAGAHWSILAMMLILFVVVQILASGADLWVSFW